MRKNERFRIILPRGLNDKLCLSFALIIPIIFFCACSQKTSVSKTANANEPVIQPSISPEASPFAASVKQDASREIDFKGVRFRSFISQVSTIETEERPAIPLENEDDKPEGVESRNITFRFRGEATDRRKEYFNGWTIRVYPVDEFREAFAVLKDDGAGFNASLAELQKVISQETVPKDRIIELHSYDVSSLVTAKFKRLDFKNGKGVFFLTQYVQETLPIENEELRAIYQGLTNDGKYYVTADFPASLIVPKDSKVFSQYKGYDVNDDLIYPKTKKPNFAFYNKYLKSIEKLLNQSAPEKFTPNLNEIEKTISSLEINWCD